MDSPYAMRWDKRDGAMPADCGWIGEDASGVWLSVHPDVALAQDPGYWRVLSRWRLTNKRDITARIFERSSAWFLEAWAEMLGAHYRAEEARYKRG